MVTMVQGMRTRKSLGGYIRMDQIIIHNINYTTIWIRTKDTDGGSDLDGDHSSGDEDEEEFVGI